MVVETLLLKRIRAMADSVLAGQSAVLTREVEVDEEVLEDLGRNADLYAFNQVLM